MTSNPIRTFLLLNVVQKSFFSLFLSLPLFLESKLLSSLLDDDNALREICECLDTPARGLGHYKAVCNYYEFNHYKIVSVFEKHPLGPSRALIEALAASHPDITVEEFANVVEEETKRKDVSKLLRGYDLAKAGNLE